MPDFYDDGASDPDAEREAPAEVFVAAGMGGEADSGPGNPTLRVDEGGRGLWVRIEESASLDGSTVRYSWVEVDADGAGGVAEKDTALWGDYHGNGAGWAREVNGNPAVPVGAVVWAWPASDGDQWFFAHARTVSPTATRPLSVVTSVCPVFDELTVSTPDGPATLRYVSGLTVERRRLLLPEAGPAECESDPAGCCAGSGGGEVTLSCCEGEALPASVCITFGGTLESGPIVLVFDGAVYSGDGTLSCMGDAQIELRCAGSQWELLITPEDEEAPIPFLPALAVSVSCDPFELHFGGFLNSFCPGSWTAEVAECAEQAGADCTQCSGDTPATWSVTVVGLAGDCSAFNGVWELAQDPDFGDYPCAWVAAEGSSQVALTFDAGYLYLDFLTDDVVMLTYKVAWPGPADCCEPLEMTFDSSLCGAQPLSLTLTPSCT